MADISRRQLIGGAAGLAAVGGFAAACGGSSGGTGTGTGGGGGGGGDPQRGGEFPLGGYRGGAQGILGGPKNITQTHHGRPLTPPLLGKATSGIPARPKLPFP